MFILGKNLGMKRLGGMADECLLSKGTTILF